MYVIIGTERQRVAPGAANEIPKESCKLSIGHCPQEPNKTSSKIYKSIKKPSKVITFLVQHMYF